MAATVKDLEDKLKEQKNQMLRALADAENARTIARRDVENAKLFAIEKFAKGLLDVADNLSLAVKAVPKEEAEKEGSLKVLLEGVVMTEALLTKTFQAHGLEGFGVVNEPFDPNKHDALFQLPASPEGGREGGREGGPQQAGHIGQVLKKGYALKGRVIRPAQVGTFK